MDTGMLFLITLGAIFANIGTSILLSSLFTNTALYLVVALLVLVISVIVTMFNMTDMANNMPAYGYIIPSIGYVMIMLSCSYFSYSVSEVFNSSFGIALIWIYIESILFVLIGIAID